MCFIPMNVHHKLFNGVRRSFPHRVLPPSGNYCIETVAPSGDHYCIDEILFIFYFSATKYAFDVNPIGFWYES